MKITKRLVSILTCIAFSFSLLSINASASSSNGHSVNSNQNIHLDEIENGYVFTQKSDDKSVAIITSNTENIIAISIMYTPNSNIIYQWILNDYPVNNFDQNNLSSWHNIISYAEKNLNKASKVEISVDEIDENTPMPFSSAGADLAKDLVDIVGSEYSDKFTRIKRMDGNDYRLYETKEFTIRKDRTLSWKSGVTVASILVSIVSVTATAGNVALISSVLGLIGSVASTVLPAGKINRYSCMVLYTRYITVDYGTTQYGHAYKIRNFEGYEDADLNSTGRAHVIPDTEILFYDPNQSEEYFNNGIFDEVYKTYNKLW